MLDSNRTPVSVHLLPGLIPPGALRGGVAVVIDVLRATTTMVHALASGAVAVIPCGEIDEARRVASALPGGTALLAGERLGLPIAGFDLGNSPAAFTTEACGGKTLVMTTTNGTRAILASLEADRVVIGAFVNLRATAERLAGELGAGGRPIHIVCAGTEGRISLEDSMLAGALASSLPAQSWDPANDEAIMVVALWHEADSAKGERGRLAQILSRGRGGRNVLALGLEGDLVDAARIDRFHLTAEICRDPLRIVAGR